MRIFVVVIVVIVVGEGQRGMDGADGLFSFFLLSSLAILIDSVASSVVREKDDEVGPN